MCSLFAAVAAIMLVLMTVAILVQIAGRSLGLRVPDAGEISGFLLGMMSFIALAYTFRTGGHIRVNLLLANAEPRFRRILEVFALVAALGIVGFFAWSSVLMTIESYEFGSVSTGMLGVPLWIPQSGMMLGILLLVLVLFEALVDVLLGRSASYEDPDAPVANGE